MSKVDPGRKTEVKVLGIEDRKVRLG